MTSGGFQVDPEALLAAAAQLDVAHTDLGTAASAFGAGHSYSASEFGLASGVDVGAAWSTFNAVWTSELTVLLGAIDELSFNAKLTVEGYREIDQNAGTPFRRMMPR